MKKIPAILVLLAVITFTSMAVAEDNKSTLTTKNNIQIEKLQKIVKEPSTQDLYKLLYENSSSSNDRIISTIQWSIGIISTFVIILLGSQIFFNYRVSKEEIRAIRSDLEERFSDLRADALDASSKERSEIIKKIDDKLTSMEQDYKESISSHYTEQSKYIDIKLESFDKDLIRLKDELKSNISYILIDLNRLEGDVWKLRGVNANALKNFISTAELEINNGMSVKYSLQYIIEALQNIKKISKDDHAALDELIKKVPEEHGTAISKIKELCISLPQYIYVDDPERPGSIKIVDL